jgi:hypothetical protein
MARLLAIVLVIGGLGVFLVVYTQGPDKAFGGALARFGKKDAPRAAYAEPEPARRGGQDWWEKEERTGPRSITQGVRERVNNAMATGAKRHGGGE